MGSTCQTTDTDVYDAHSEPPGSPPTQRSTLSHRCAIRTGERGRAVESSRSSLAMPHRKHVGSRAQLASETHPIDTERMMSHRTCRQLLSRHPCEQCAQRTVMSMWVMSMACMGAWLGGRGLAYGGGRTHPTQRERHRARPPTLCRAAASKRQPVRAQGPLAARPLLRSSSRLGECNSQPARLVHSAVAFAVLCPAEAARVPSIAVRGIFRNLLPL